MSAGDSGKGRKPGEILALALKYAFASEKNTPEGITNTAVIALATLGAVVNFIAGATLEIGGDSSSWGAKLSFSDAIGTVAVLAGAGLLCVIIVGGCNYLQEKRRSGQ